MTDPSSYSRLSPNLMHFSWRRDHLSLPATRRPGGVCSRETGQTCLLPRWGFSTYWAKEWGWRGSLKGFNWGGEIWWGLLFLWDPAVSFLWDGSPRTEGTRNRRCGWNQEGGNVRARCLLFAREWAISFRRESSPQTDEWRVKLGGWQKMRPPSLERDHINIEWSNGGNKRNKTVFMKRKKALLQRTGPVGVIQNQKRQIFFLVFSMYVSNTMLYCKFSWQKLGLNIFLTFWLLN